ncbi:hypothetical protein [Nocardioides sp.]|uniref:hypothetical protein n=1 Tax=Nocardioides sp. TaxID=35761 RepID=UPI00378507D3
MPGLTRGPLPARVYWVRRLMVLGTAVLLVVGIARLLDGSSDASGGGTARLAAEQSPTTGVSTTGSASTATTPAPTPRKHRTGTVRPTPTPTPTSTPTLAVPQGPCDPTDIAVTPQVSRAVAGRDVPIVLQLRTIESPACTWRTGHQELSVDITSGKDAIWSSRQCPRAIPVEDVVVRRAVTTHVTLTWTDARRSDDRCSKLAGWAMPGWYHVTAAALGGEPSDLQFELTTPTAATVTRTAKPTQSPHPTRSPSRSPSGTATTKPSGNPSAGHSG